MILSKTNYMSGIQCVKMLWLDKHKPEEKVIPPFIQTILNRGNEFGDQMMGIFGPYVEVKEYLDGTTVPNIRKMADRTKELLEADTPVICEAAFLVGDTYCAVDILRKVDNGYEMYEVKSSKTVTKQHILDAAFQSLLVMQSGLNLTKVCIVYKGDPYNIKDITDETKVLRPEIEENLDWLVKAMYWPHEPYCEMGDHCNKPYGCWYKDYCKKK